jgi:uncharacterized RDD family membrane protein YckC
LARRTRGGPNSNREEASRIIMNHTILPKEFPGLNDSIYAGFWRRLGAFLIDLLINAPIIIATFYIQNLNRLNFLYTLIPSYGFYIFYNFYLVRRYEGTPGKRIVKIKIKQKDGKRITWKEVILREIVNLVLSGMTSLAYLIAVLQLSDNTFESLPWLKKSVEISKFYPVWQKPVEWLFNIWIWSEFVILLTNKRRRALHDYIAGTLVIKEKFEKIAESKKSSGCGITAPLI